MTWESTDRSGIRLNPYRCLTVARPAIGRVVFTRQGLTKLENKNVYQRYIGIDVSSTKRDLSDSLGKLPKQIANDPVKIVKQRGKFSAARAAKPIIEHRRNAPKNPARN